MILKMKGTVKEVHPLLDPDNSYATIGASIVVDKNGREESIEVRVGAKITIEIGE